MTFSNNDTNEWVQWIEDGISKHYINFHEYNGFINIQRIGSGEFGEVFRANLESSNIVVALKSINNQDNYIMKEIVKEVYILGYIVLAVPFSC